MQFIIWLISGITTSWLTSQVMKGSRLGLIGDLVVGVLDGIVLVAITHALHRV